jgi:hypothetical protein
MSSRHGIFKGRHVMIVEGEEARTAAKDLVTVLPVPLAEDGFGREVDEEARY